RLPREAMLDALTTALRERYGVTLLGALGFENAYALAMRPARATEAGIPTIAELAPQTPHLKLGSDLEFLGRPEWTALKQAYSLSFAEEKSYNPTFMYRAIVDGSVDVISAFSSDGRIAADNLVVLPDVKRAIPAYDAVILISPRRRNDERLRAALAPLIGAIPVERMRQANYMLDRDSDKATARDAARFLAAGAGLVERGPIWRDLPRFCRQYALYSWRRQRCMHRGTLQPAGLVERSARGPVDETAQQPFFFVSSIASSSVAAVTVVFTSSPLSSMMQLTR